MTATSFRWLSLPTFAALCILSGAIARDAHAQSVDAGTIEPRSIAGPPVPSWQPRPAPKDVPRRACSFQFPVCVHAAASVRDESMEFVLATAEKFYRAVISLGLPQPLPDGGLGGDFRHDLYLLPNAAEIVTITDPLAPGSIWDQASAFTILPPPLPPWGCDAETAIVRSLARASVLRLDAGVEDAAVAMAETHLADIVTDCGISTLVAVDDLQRRPERFFGYHRAGEPSGAFLFARFLDDTYGIGVPGGVLFSLLAVAGQRTRPEALNFANEPDLFDALRSNMRARGKPFEDLLLEFAIHRAFIGSRSDDGHLIDVSKYGDNGRVRFEWSIAYESRDRRLAPRSPIDALGATYLWMDMRQAPPNPKLTFVADWEVGVLFHWAIVKVDEQGIELGRISIAGINGSTHAERSLVGLQGVAGLLIVGVNAGSIDRSRPFDPDDGELARSYTVTLYPQ